MGRRFISRSECVEAKIEVHYLGCAFQPEGFELLTAVATLESISIAYLVLTIPLDLRVGCLQVLELAIISYAGL